MEYNVSYMEYNESYMKYNVSYMKYNVSYMEYNVSYMKYFEYLFYFVFCINICSWYLVNFYLKLLGVNVIKWILKRGIFNFVE
ncbi:MAG: hypothetical protein ACP5RD_07260 [bacterium]